MAYDLSQLYVMVVDDNEHARALVRTILHTLGVRNIKLCADAESAFKELAEFPADIVVTDWEMPETSGVDLTKRLRTDPNSPNPYIPVIMMTGHTERSKVLQARDAGVTEFLVKPISSRLLCQRLQAVIEKPRPFVRAKGFFGPDRRRRSSLDFDGQERRAAQSGEMAALTGSTSVDKLLETL
jgi:CheY-like chemotaxis protein